MNGKWFSFLWDSVDRTGRSDQHRRAIWLAGGFTVHAAAAVAVVVVVSRCDVDENENERVTGVHVLLNQRHLATDVPLTDDQRRVG